jgi:hypothetical protein
MLSVTRTRVRDSRVFEMMTKVVKASGGHGQSGLVSYIAKRDHDAEREGRAERRLFSASDDDLDVERAERHLSSGFELERDDLTHLVVSLTDREYESLGDTSEQRREALREVVRDGMAELERELRVDGLRYAAGIHLNTENPHCHIAIHKDALARETLEPARLKGIPRDLLPARVPSAEREPDSRSVDERRSILDIFERAHLEHEAPIRQVQFTVGETGHAETRALVDDWSRAPTEAEILVGRWIELESTPARHHSPEHSREKLSLRESVRRLDRAAAEEGKSRVAGYIERDGLRDLVNGDHLKVLDAHGAERERFRATRAHPEPGRGENEGQPGRTPQETLGREIALRLTIEHLQWKLESAARKNLACPPHVARSLAREREALRETAPRAANVRAAFRVAGIEPKPAIASRELDRLQEEAVERGDASAVRTLEGLRAPDTRTVDDVRRLAALTLLARTETRVLERRVDEFEHSRHVTRFEIDGRSLSLATADRLERRAERERDFYKTRADEIRNKLDRSKTWTPYAVTHVWKREQLQARQEALATRADAAGKSVEQCASLHVKVLDRIGDARQELGGRLARANDLAATLGGIHERELSRFSGKGADAQEPRFTARELRRLEERALTLRDPRLLLVVDRAREKDPSMTQEARAARAEGRAVAAEVELGGAERSAAIWRDKSRHIPVLYTDGNGVDRTARLRDVEPHGPLMARHGGLLERREDRTVRYDVRAAVTASMERTRRGQSELSRFAQAAREIALSEAGRLRSEGRDTVKPEFTHNESARMESVARTTRDPDAPRPVRPSPARDADSQSPPAPSRAR